MRHHHMNALDPERRQWQNPETVLAEVGLKPGMTMADLGCGGGFFTLPAAKIVGGRGRVYGIDADGLAIDNLKAQAASEGLSNLVLTVGRAEDVVLCEACADIVFFGIVLHDFADPAQVLRNARRMIKPDGRLVNLDWKKEPGVIGPPLGIRFSTAEATRLIETAGFTVDEVKENGLYHYLVLARPQPS